MMTRWLKRWMPLRHCLAHGERVTVAATLLIRLTRELALISLEQHRLQQRRYAIQAAITSLRTGEAEALVEARLDAAEMAAR